MRRFIIAISLIIILALGGAALPGFLLSGDRIGEILREKAPELGLDSLDTGSITWSWLPVPTITVTGLSVRGDGFVFETEEARLTPWFPTFSSIFDLYPLPVKIELRDPQLRLTALPGKGDDEGFHPPVRVLEVVRGRVSVTDQARRTLMPFLEDDLVLTGIRGRADMGARDVEFDLSADSSLAEKLSARGEVRLDDLKFRIKFRALGLDLGSLRTDRRKTRAGLLEGDKITVSVKAAGRYGGEIEGRLTAYSPCLTVKPEGSEVVVSCGSLMAGFDIAPEGLSVDLEALEFEAPHMRLSGRLRVAFPQAGNEGAKESSRTEVDLKVKGEDIDLAQVRKAVRKLLSWDKIAMTVTDIVLGGRAGNLFVGFSGPLSSMSEFEQWVIRADVEDVPVYIGEADLRLDSVTGYVGIEQGVLTVAAKELQLRQTVSRQAKALVGLTGHDHRIEVDAPLDAPLTDVYWALGKFVDSEEFHEVMEEVQVKDGRATGLLRLRQPRAGGGLRVEVDVSDMSGTISYLPLGWDIGVRGGGLEYRPEFVAWSDLSFKASGKEEESVIRGCDGRVRLGKEAFLEISRAKGDVSARQVKRLLAFVGVDLASRPMRLSSLSGRVDLEDLRLKVPFGKGEVSWMAVFAPKELTVEFDHDIVPWPVTLGGRRISMSATRLGLDGITLEAAGARIEASGEVRQLNDWAKMGLDLRLSGLLSQDVREFLLDKGLIPRQLAPRTPCTVQDLRVRYRSNGQASIEVEGALSWGEELHASFDFKDAGAGLELHDLVIVDGQRRAAISMAVRPDLASAAGTKAGESQWLSASFSGRLNASTLDRMLANNVFLQGDVSGDLRLGVTNENGRSLLLAKGELSGHRFFWPLSQDKRIEFARFDLSVDRQGGNAVIESSFEDDTFVVEIDFAAKPGNLMLFGDLAIPHLSDETIYEFRSYFERLGTGKKEPSGTGSDHDREADGGGLLAPLSLDVTGSVSFAIDRLDVDLKTLLPSMESHDLSAGNITGFVEFLSEDRWSVKADSSAMCGTMLEVAIKSMGEGRLSKEIRMRTPQDRPAEFQQFLSCVGGPSDRLAGPFVLDLHMAGQDGAWSSGELSIDAHDGSIAQGGLLSRVLGVLNLTDLFSVSRNGVFGASGFPYSEMVVRARIDEPNHLEVTEAHVKGRGLNLYVTGGIDLSQMTLDLVFFASPLKSVDALVTNVPILGAIIGGKHKTFFVIPVKVTGPFDAPEIDVLQAGAVTNIFKKLIFNVIKAPFSIFIPEKGDGSSGQKGDGSQSPRDAGAVEVTGD